MVQRGKLHSEQLRLLEEVFVGNYYSREGGFIKLRFARDKFAYVHMATFAQYQYLESLIGSYMWVSQRWRSFVHKYSDELVEVLEYVITDIGVCGELARYAEAEFEEGADCNESSSSSQNESLGSAKCAVRFRSGGLCSGKDVGDTGGKSWRKVLAKVFRSLRLKP